MGEYPGSQVREETAEFENGELTIHGRRNPTNAGKKRALWEYEPAHYHRSFRLSEDVAPAQGAPTLDSVSLVKYDRDFAAANKDRLLNAWQAAVGI